MGDERVTYCIDVGSVRSGNFGWARVQDGTWEVGEGTSAMAGLTERLADDCAGTAAVSVGFESPLFLPLRSDPLALTLARAPWEHSSFAGGLGATVLVTGLVETAHVLGAQPRPVTTDPQRSGAEVLVVWEAFISGSATQDTTTPSCPGGSHGEHACDALVGALEWHRWMETGALQYGAVRRAGSFDFGDGGRGLDLVAAVTGAPALVDQPASWAAVILQLPKPRHSQDP